MLSEGCAAHQLKDCAKEHPEVLRLMAVEAASVDDSQLVGEQAVEGVVGEQHQALRLTLQQMETQSPVSNEARRFNKGPPYPACKLLA